MTTKRIFALVLALALVGGGMVGPVDAGGKVKKFNGKFGGTFLGSRIDVEPTLGPVGDSPADWSTAVGKSNRGRFTGQGVAESKPGADAACPGGLLTIAPGVGFGTNTTTFTQSTDQLYAVTVTRETCLAADFSFTITETFVYVGGTGKYAGASGGGESHASGFFQAFDIFATPPQGFGSFTGTFKAEIILP